MNYLKIYKPFEVPAATTLGISAAPEDTVKGDA
jgi:hypothetical protein